MVLTPFLVIVKKVKVSRTEIHLYLIQYNNVYCFITYKWSLHVIYNIHDVCDVEFALGIVEIFCYQNNDLCYFKNFHLLFFKYFITCHKALNVTVTDFHQNTVPNYKVLNLRDVFI